MGLDSKYGNEDVKQQGKWFSITGDDGEVRIRHASNEDYRQFLIDNLDETSRDLLNALSDDNRVIQADGSGDFDEEDLEQFNQLLKEGAAKHLLVDWKNISLDDPDMAAEFDKEPGENIGYSAERAETMFDLIPDFYSEVRDIAQERAAFTREQESRDTKN